MVMRIVNPVAESEVLSAAPAPRVPSIDGLVVGFLVNEKGDATATDFELDSHIMEARLRREYAIKDAVRMVKPSAFKPGALGMLDEMAGQCDLIINGLGK